jgi:hypothetical protein
MWRLLFQQSEITMRKVLVIAASLLLSSCASISPGTNPGAVLNPNPTDAVIQQIIAGTITACAYQPEASAIANLLSSFVPGAAPVTGVVNQVVGAICGQITSNKGVRRGVAMTPVVNGIPITGHFVQSYRHRR